MSAKQLFKRAIHLIAVLLVSFVAGGIGQDAAVLVKRGDINQDANLSIFDLIALLENIHQPEPLESAADIDTNGKIDVFDLLGWLSIFGSMSLVPEENFNLKIKIGFVILDDCNFDPQAFGRQEGGGFSVGYKTYTNKDIENFMLIFGNDTLFDTDGTINVSTKLDTTSHPYYFRSDSVPWLIKAKCLTGEELFQNGTSQMLFPMSNAAISYDSYRVASERIDFPLILKGAWQRFCFCMDDISNAPYNLVIDLNPTGKDSVVFTDIDTLAAAIMHQAIQNDSSRATAYSQALLVAPAKDTRTGTKLDRLIMHTTLGTSFPDIQTMDNNQSLLAKLGFPAWLRTIEKPYRTARYEVYDGWEAWLLLYVNFDPY